MRKNRIGVALACSLALTGLMMSGCGSAERKTSATGVKTEEAKEKDAAGKEDTAGKKDADIAEREKTGDSSALKGAVTIKNAEDLLAFAERVNAGEPELNAVLAADIDLSSVCSESAGSWTPIADYNGTFDGAGFTIANLYVTGGSEDYAGLFGWSGKNSVIENIVLENVEIMGGEYTGAVTALTDGAVRNCRVSGKLEGYYNVGGIAGAVNHTAEADSPEKALEGCVNTAEVRSEQMERNGAVGGIVGATAQNIRDCHNTGLVYGSTGFVGGIVGEAEGTYYEKSGYTVRIEDCTNDGNVDGVLFVGGITGYLSDGFAGNCKNTGTVLGYNYLGGICGVAKGKAEKGEFLSMAVNCVNTGDITMYPLESGGSVRYVDKKGSADYYSEQFAGGIASFSERSVFMNCRNSGNLICDTKKYKIECGALHIAADQKQKSNLYINCLSTAEITPPSSGEDDFMKKGVSVTGLEYGADCSAAVFYTGEQCYDNIEPTDQAALSDGTVLAQLNAYPDGVPEEFLTRIEESGIDFELCGWKQGTDGPVLEWEE